MYACSKLLGTIIGKVEGRVGGMVEGEKREIRAAIKQLIATGWQATVTAQDLELTEQEWQELMGEESK